jgi:hypothetical protein
MNIKPKSELKPSLAFDWSKFPAIGVFGFFSYWRWQQETRHGYTIRIGWLLIKVGTPAPNEAFVDAGQSQELTEEDDHE